MRMYASVRQSFVTKKTDTMFIPVNPSLTTLKASSRGGGGGGLYSIRMLGWCILRQTYAKESTMGISPSILLTVS